MIFINFNAAFESVDICTTWILCSSLGLEQVMVKFLKALCSETYCSIKAYDTLSSPFQFTTGVRKASILSPLLFVIVIDWAPREATQDVIFGIQLDDLTISDLYFADDVWLLEDDFNAAQELLSSVIAAVARMVLIINAKKTQAMFSYYAPANLKCEIDVLENVS